MRKYRLVSGLPYHYFQHLYLTTYELTELCRTGKEFEINLGPFALAYLPNLFPTSSLHLIPRITTRENPFLKLILEGDFFFFIPGQRRFVPCHFEIRTRLSINFASGMIGANLPSERGVDLFPLIIGLLSYYQPSGCNFRPLNKKKEITIVSDKVYEENKEKDECAIGNEIRKHEQKLDAVVSEKDDKKKDKDPKKGD